MAVDRVGVGSVGSVGGAGDGAEGGEVDVLAGQGVFGDLVGGDRFACDLAGGDRGGLQLAGPTLLGGTRRAAYALPPKAMNTARLAITLA